MLLRKAKRSDHGKIIQLFKSLQQESEGQYPSIKRVEEDGGMGAWLRLEKPLERWVIECSGKIVGHSQTMIPSEIDARDYYIKAFSPLDIEELGIIQRLAISQDFRRRGLAAQIIESQVESARHERLLPGVVINSKQKASLALFQKAGWATVRSYKGMHESSMISLIKENITKR